MSHESIDTTVMTIAFNDQLIILPSIYNTRVIKSFASTTGTCEQNAYDKFSNEINSEQMLNILQQIRMCRYVKFILLSCSYVTPLYKETLLISC